MGGIVLCGTDEGHDLVIDGQQRTTTITVLIAVCRDYLFKECGGNPKAQQAAIAIHNDYIVSGGVVAERNDPYLILGELDREWFATRIQVSPGASNEYSPPDIGKVPYKLPGSNRLLWRAYQYFNKTLTKWLGHKPTEDRVADVIRITRQLATKTWFVITRVPDDTQAYTLFEVLNDRGLELSISDLIKNVVLARAASVGRLPRAKDYWGSIVDSLDYENVSSFLRYHWMSHNGEKITENDLFPKLKSQIREKSAADLVAYLKSLSEEADNYAELLARSQTHEDLARELALINSYGFRVGNTVLLAVWSATGDKKVRLDVVRELKNFFVKFAIFSNQVTNELEGVMAKLAQGIRKDVVRGVAELKATFKKKLPSKQTIKDGFLALEPTSSVGRALLIEIETELAGTEKAAGSAQKVNVEHIFPQSPNDDWVEAFEAKGAEDSYMARLGNMTLLDAKLNKQASNKPFETKRTEFYSKSDFTVTKLVAKNTKWTAASVDKRQAELYDISRKIWGME